MPQVDFYIITHSDRHASLLVACRLLAKAYQQQRAVYAYMNTEQEAIELDRLLWTFNDISFIPHGLHHTSADLSLPIHIGYDSLEPPNEDILINFHHTIPNFYQRFKRVIEFTLQDPVYRDLARQHYRFYREQGCELHSHQL